MSGQARSFGQQALSTQVSLAAQHVWSPLQDRAAGQHEPPMHDWLAPQQVPLQIRPFGQHWPLRQVWLPLQQVLPQTFPLAQQVPARQVWLLVQHALPQTRPVGQHWFPMHC
jgi:hypothetical protein